MSAHAKPLPKNPPDQGANGAPSNCKGHESVAPVAPPFASLHVRIFKESLADVDGKSKCWEESCGKEEKRVLDGFEEVLKVSRHVRLSDRIDLFRGLITDVCLVMAGCFAGVMIMLSCLASIGVFKL